MRRLEAFLAFLVCSVLPSAGQHGSSKTVNPYTAPENLAAGARLFRAQCGTCHGSNGRGTTSGPDLTGPLRRGNSDEAIFQTISKGVPGTSMPAFSFDGQRIWELVTNIRALSIARSGSQAAGNIADGRQIYSSSGCGNCHSVSGQGGYTGPDLTEVGLRLSLPELRTAVLEPDASVSSEYWSVSAQTTAGRRLTGTRLNEDTHSLQLRDPQGKLISVLKRDLSGFEIIRKSPMPATAAKLSTEKLTHLLAWLSSLRGNGEAGGAQ